MEKSLRSFSLSGAEFTREEQLLRGEGQRLTDHFWQEPIITFLTLRRLVTQLSLYLQ